MSKVLDKATKHFQDLVQNNLKEFYVEEWDSTVYYRPTLTNGKTSEALIETLIIRCLDENGKPLFNGPDRVTISNEVDPAVILRIVGAVNGTTVTNEEVEKNLE